jgi:methylmalonyl-CoA/ethylmalonyl-CoA epimerase
VYVPSLADGVAEMAAAGHEPVQWGTGYGAEGDGGFAFFDLRPLLSIYLELIEVPRVRVEPELVYGAGAA